MIPLLIFGFAIITTIFILSPVIFPKKRFLTIEDCYLTFFLWFFLSQELFNLLLGNIARARMIFFFFSEPDVWQRIAILFLTFLIILTISVLIKWGTIFGARKILKLVMNKRTKKQTPVMAIPVDVTKESVDKEF